MRNKRYLMLTKALNKKEFNYNSGFLPGLKFCTSRPGKLPRFLTGYYLARSAKVFLAIIFTLLSGSGSLSAQVSPAWITPGQFPGSGSSSAYELETDASGNVFIAGEKSYDIAPLGNIFLIKYDANGNLIWLKTYVTPNPQPIGPFDLCLDAGGNAYLAFINPVTPWAIAIQKYRAADGFLEWTTEIPGSSFNAFEWQVRPVFMISDGSYIYIGGTKFETGVSGSRMLAVKMNTGGGIEWSRTFKGSGIYANTKSIATDPSGNVYIAGDAWNTSIDYCVVKYNANGDYQWHAFIDGSVYHDTDVAEKVIVDNNGNVYVTGYSQITSYEKDILTVKYNAGGVFQWQRSYGNPEYDSNNAWYLATTAGNELLVGGYVAYETPYPGSGKNFCLLKYNTAGDLQWSAIYDYQNNLDNHPFDFDTSPDGSIYIAGTSLKSCEVQQYITIVKVNPQGTIAWDVCIPGLMGTPWEIIADGNDEFTVALLKYNNQPVYEAVAARFEPAAPVIYEADMTDIWFSSQTAPPLIDNTARTVLATVHDTANLATLIPFITTSEHACFYPEDEMVTDFTTPVWYNVSSFDGETEKWWVVTVQQGPVSAGNQTLQEIKVYPNPASDWVQLQLPAINHRSLTIELMNMQGVVLLKQRIENSEALQGFDISHLPAGAYFCFISGLDTVSIKRIVKIR
ncbi:MAG: T9SS type A sorting domain-containing protein [Lentimicrobium sp.]